jgi:hypothetical protein
MRWMSMADRYIVVGQQGMFEIKRGLDENELWRNSLCSVVRLTSYQATQASRIPV